MFTSQNIKWKIDKFFLNKQKIQIPNKIAREKNNKNRKAQLNCDIHHSRSRKQHSVSSGLAHIIMGNACLCWHTQPYSRNMIYPSSHRSQLYLIFLKELYFTNSFLWGMQAVADILDQSWLPHQPIRTNVPLANWPTYLGMKLNQPITTPFFKEKINPQAPPLYESIKY